jgi:hypothetical protein
MNAGTNMYVRVLERELDTVQDNEHTLEIDFLETV